MLLSISKTALIALLTASLTAGCSFLTSSQQPAIVPAPIKLPPIEQWALKECLPVPELASGSDPDLLFFARENSIVNAQCAGKVRYFISYIESLKYHTTNKPEE